MPLCHSAGRLRYVRGLKHSKEVENRVGRIRYVHLDPLGPFDVDEQSASMAVEIVGERGQLRLDVRALKNNGSWSLIQEESRP